MRVGRAIDLHGSYSINAIKLLVKEGPTYPVQFVVVRFLAENPVDGVRRHVFISYNLNRLWSRRQLLINISG